MSEQRPKEDVTVTNRPEAGSDEEVEFTLAARAGPDTGKTLVVSATHPVRVLLGQSEACDMRLGDSEVSRRHAALEVVGSRLRVTDLASTNGTFVNGVEIRDAFLIGGEVVRVGATELAVTRRTTRSERAPEVVGFGRTMGASAEMRRLYPLCERLAQTDVPLIIEGETGTGKELLAESIHEAGPRASKPFIVFDCTAVPPNLLESELFGHERGAFTGAVTSRKGLFEEADGGTLLIDEIGELDVAMQPKLLRALERREFRRVGGNRSLQVDVRVVAATRRDLDREVAEGRFRDDLFHRLAVARIELPPLRRRTGDISLLAQEFFTALGGTGSVPQADLARWEAYEWPGNVRELRNAVLRYVTLGALAHVAAAEGTQPADLESEERAGGSDFIDEVVAAKLPFADARHRVLEAFEQRYLEQMLQAYGSPTLAARAAGVAPRYFRILRAKHKTPAGGSEPD